MATTRFGPLCTLIREAERRLVVAGHSDGSERLSILRGVYYGTTWSRDFKVEHSALRNAGFRVYLASPLDPMDPTDIFDCGLFEALRDSTDIVEHGRKLDFGHAMIGLDARQRSVSRSIPIPGNGGTGLEICTWLGDLGGGAGMLAVDRVATPTTSALHRFIGSNFGGSINLEGDVAGYVIARDPSSSDSSSAPILPSDGIAGAVEKYIGSPAPGPEWSGRASAFIRMNGGAVSGPTITNKAELISSFAAKIESFGVNYLIARMKDKKVSPSQVRGAASQLTGAAHEVAEVFVNALSSSLAHGGAAIEARPPAPAITSPGSPNLTLLAAAFAAEVL